ncbi:hypothetical protein G4G28_17070 [Massilia sp. Dwa41.01b]|uniref:hypothetical protein n=1 Tax=unclassified Massilia TaxID=2609279 RepID=UPI0015FF8F33|nr:MULTISPECIES: hypothetical protein [unclassified Massilia]QNA89766.1 hypothetical protein G4G28_17070 [Massilia sp. Dwa41.01b]QNB00660.1 hypothetical protein G4G31_20645 [Massilia sp. Se16.2.3]
MLSAWLHFFDSVPAATRERIAQALAGARVATVSVADRSAPYGLAVLTEVDGAALAQLRLLSAQSTVLAIAAGPDAPATSDSWALLGAGAADVLCWPDGAMQVEQVTARLTRWAAVRKLVDTPPCVPPWSAPARHGARWCAMWSRSPPSPIRRYSSPLMMVNDVHNKIQKN